MVHTWNFVGEGVPTRISSIGRCGKFLEACIGLCGRISMKKESL